MSEIVEHPPRAGVEIGRPDWIEPAGHRRWRFGPDWLMFVRSNSAVEYSGKRFGL